MALGEAWEGLGGLKLDEIDAASAFLMLFGLEMFKIIILNGQSRPVKN